MTTIEYAETVSEPTRVQRWSHFLTMASIILMFLYGLSLRQGILEASTLYENAQVGITANYPANWLLDESNDLYVFRVRDMSRIGYKTTIQIAIEPIGPTTTPQNVLNFLALRRSTQLAQYNTLSIGSTEQQDLGILPSMTYFFTTSSNDAALEILPTVVVGRDVLFLLRGQAIIATFRANAATFQDDEAVFDRFLNTLELE